jgi:hypothetical protein
MPASTPPRSTDHRAQTNDSTQPLDVVRAGRRAVGTVDLRRRNAVADCVAMAAAAIEAGLCRAALFYRSTAGRATRLHHHRPVEVAG